ncbi:MAG: hypothetical protein RR897_24115, partial [Pseudomonas sp.]
MTNNPTIDGVLVPRKLLKCYLSGDGGDWVEAGHELRALLDAKAHPCQVLLDGCDGSCAPAVERQEPVAFRFKWDYDHGNGWCRGAIRFVETMEEVDHEDKSTWRDITPLYEVAPEVAALQSTIDQLEDKLNKAIDLDFQRREAIEQLQARVQELESGRVDGIWFPRELGDGLAE